MSTNRGEGLSTGDGASIDADAGRLDSSNPRESLARLRDDGARGAFEVTPVAESAVARGPEPSILIVDDRLELLDSLDALIRAYGYEPDRALGGREAMERLERKAYDVVLLDLIMPEVSGHDILDHAAERNLAAKIIVVSGDDSFDGVKHALQRGAYDFVKKPYEAQELMATLDTALRHRELEAANQVMQGQLKASEALHRFIVNSSPDLVYMLDRDGRFTFLNDRLETLLGYGKDDLLGEHYSVLVEEADLELARNVFNERRGEERTIGNVELRLKSRITRRGTRFEHARPVWVELTAKGVYEDLERPSGDGFVGTFGTARDISERKEAEDLINFQAYHDLLTQLPNRALLKDRLGVAINQARRNQRKFAVMFLDLDRFKLVNDTLGHGMGDRLLKAVANRLQSCLRSGDTLSRFGGDEFTLLLPEVRTHDDVVVIADKIIDRLSTPFIIDNHELFVGASVGIAMFPEAGETEDVLIQNADIAMYHVKKRGKNGYQFFSDDMNSKFSTRLSLERELRNGLAQGQLRVFYQPQVSLDDGAITGVEALVRWRHPARGVLEPVEFLSVAEDAGMIVQIDEMVQHQAFDDVAAWHRMGFGDVSLSVNVSAGQLDGSSFVADFLRVLEDAGLDPHAVKLELTESTLMKDVEHVVPKLNELRRHGVGIAIDDFGTGYSSLSYLQQFPINTLKIDRSFVHDIRDLSDPEGHSHRRANIVDAIVVMAKGLHLDLIAEGVETRNQLDYLRRLGCGHVQGYIFGRAVAAQDLESLLRDNPFPRVLHAPGVASVSSRETQAAE